MPSEEVPEAKYQSASTPAQQPPGAGVEATAAEGLEAGFPVAVVAPFGAEADGVLTLAALPIRQ